MTRRSINIENRKTIFDFNVNEKASISKLVEKEIVNKLADVSGDRNPIHLDEKYAEKGPFKKCIAHGLFCIGMISNLIGNVLPGSGAVLLEQHMNYCHPVYFGDIITATVEIVEIDEIKRYITLRQVCVNQNDIVVLDGLSKVKLY